MTVSRPRFDILDGLRGVAALMVVVFHLSEAFSYDPVYKHLNHGFLAVDFFFVLSGFVIGYAYDERIKEGSMTFWTFLKSRLIRLQPMVLFGLLLGAAFFYFQSCAYYPRIATTGIPTLLLYIVLGFLMIPQTPEQNIRGNEELFSLNIPQWSLIYEYVANLLYGLFVCRLGKRGLAVLVFMFAVTLTDCALSLNLFGLLEKHEYPWSLNGGFTWNVEHAYIGLSRVGYSFFAGLLLYRFGCRLAVHSGGAASFWLLLSVPTMSVGMRIPFLTASSTFAARCLFFLLSSVWVPAGSSRGVTLLPSAALWDVFPMRFILYIILMSIFSLRGWIPNARQRSACRFLSPPWWCSSVLLPPMPLWSAMTNLCVAGYARSF